MSKAADTAATAWAALNDRQQQYLLAIYHADQDAERDNRAAFRDGARSRPAAEWRWLNYGYVSAPGAPLGTLQKALGDRRDQGAGATLAVLSDCALIETRTDPLEGWVFRQPWYREDTYHLSAQITRAGRAAARAGGVDDLQPGRPGKGMLSEWLWGVLVELWSAADNGVSQDRRITAWQYLEHRRTGSLISRDGSRYRLSALGAEHYRTHWATYARLYPRVDAPHPDGTPVWPDTVDRDLKALSTVVHRLHQDLITVDTEHNQLTTATPAPDATNSGSPELARARTLRRQRDKLAEQHRTRRLTLLTAHRDELRQLYRQAAARYAGAALAVTAAAIDGTDPARALSTAAPVALETTGRPTVDLAHPVTCLTGIDVDITSKRTTALRGEAPAARRRGRRNHLPALPLDPPARDLATFATYLAGLVADGRLVRLRLRLPSEGTTATAPAPAPAATSRARRRTGKENA